MSNTSASLEQWELRGSVVGVEDQDKTRDQIPKGCDAKLGNVTPLPETQWVRLREEFMQPIP